MCVPLYEAVFIRLSSFKKEKAVINNQFVKRGVNFNLTLIEFGIYLQEMWKASDHRYLTYLKFQHCEIVLLYVIQSRMGNDI